MNMPAVAPPKHQLAEIQLNHLRPYANQRRKFFDPDALNQLAESIKVQGVTQPILVRTAKPGPDCTKTIEPYEIIAGERRWRASGIAGTATIPAIIRDDLDDAGVEAVHLIENLQRADLTLEEQCDGAAALVALRGFDKAVEESGMSKAWMSRHSRLSTMDELVQDLVRQGKVTSLEIAHDIQQLKGYTSKGFDEAVAAFQLKDTWSRPMSRAQLRERVRNAKEAYELRQEKAEAKKKEQKELRERINADPTLKAKLAAEKAKDPETRRKEREVKVKELKAEGERISKELTAKLLQLAGFDLTQPQKKKGGRRDELPLEVDMSSQFTNYGHETLPQSAETANFSVSYNGAIDVIAPALNLFAPGAKVDLAYDQLDDVTQDEARRIEKALGRPLKWMYHQGKDMPAKKLRALIEGADVKKAAPKAASKPATKPGANTSVADFLAARVIKKKGSQVKASDLHERYCMWCEAQGRKFEILPLNGGANEFGAAIAKAKIERKRQKTGYQYLNIELLSVEKLLSPAPKA